MPCYQGISSLIGSGNPSCLSLTVHEMHHFWMAEKCWEGGSREGGAVSSLRALFCSFSLQFLNGSCGGLWEQVCNLSIVLYIAALSRRLSERLVQWADLLVCRPPLSGQPPAQSGPASPPHQPPSSRLLSTSTLHALLPPRRLPQNGSGFVGGSMAMLLLWRRINDSCARRKSKMG